MVLSGVSFPRSEKFSGKGIDGEVAEVLAETLSLNGKLFEIYFVRLIGTPNQQFKKDIGLRIGINVSSSS